MTARSSSHDHVIIGAGIAADKAARAIREVSADADILILGSEPDPPVYRPALSKDLWLKPDTSLDRQWLGTADTGAELRLGTTVTALDPVAHQITTDTGETITYGNVLIATGAGPRAFAGAPDDPRIFLYRSSGDYRRLRAALDEAPAGQRVAVVGGGYIGSELAAGLRTAGAEVTVYFDGQKLLERLLPADITAHVAEVYTARGIGLVNDFLLDSIEVDGSVTLHATDGRTASADLVLLGLGAVPNTALATDAGLAMEQGGIRVDTLLGTSAPDVYAAGDIITFDDPLLGTRRVEHIDMAEKSGTVAGYNMAGRRTEFHYTPFFYSDLFSDGYEAVGDLSTRHGTITEWNAGHSAAVVYYLRDTAVLGVLLWNTWGQVGRAREIMAESKTRVYSEEELRGLITPGG